MKCMATTNSFRMCLLHKHDIPKWTNLCDKWCFVETFKKFVDVFL